MKLKMVGLGKMGLNLALNMKEHGVDVEGFDVNEEARKKAESENIKTYASLEDVASKCDLGNVTCWKNYKFCIASIGRVV